MFEEEEEQQDVAPLKAALEEAAAAAEAQGRSKQPGQAVQCNAWAYIILLLPV